MAESPTLRQFKRVTLGSSNVATKVNLPSGARRITIQFITNDGKLAHTGTDAAAIGSDYFTCQSDTTYELELVEPGERSRLNAMSAIYLASATGSTVVEVFVE
jgi:hypothetical protein